MVKKERISDGGNMEETGMKTCCGCGRSEKSLFPGNLCQDCYKAEMPSRKDLEEKWRSFTGPPVDRMIGGSRKNSEVVTK